MRVAGPDPEPRECRAAYAGPRVALGERDASVSGDRDRGQAPPPGEGARCAEVGKLRQAGSEVLQRTPLPLPTTTEGTKRDAHPGLLTPSPRLAHFCLPRPQATVRGVKLASTGRAGGITSALGLARDPQDDVYLWQLSFTLLSASWLARAGWGRMRQRRVFSRAGGTGGFRVFANNSEALKHLEQTWQMGTNAGVMEG